MQRSSDGLGEDAWLVEGMLKHVHRNIHAQRRMARDADLQASFFRSRLIHEIDMTLFGMCHSLQKAIQCDQNESRTIPMLCVQAETRFWLFVF